MIDREFIFKRLKEVEPELRKSGIEALSLFGSAARGEMTEKSDIDLSIKIDPQAEIGLFDLIRLQKKLSEILGYPVDLVSEPIRKHSLREIIEKERFRVF